MYKLLIITIPIILFLSSCEFGSNYDQEELTENIYQKNLKTSKIETGWYLMTDSTSGYKMILEPEGEIHYINLKPFLIQRNFWKFNIEIYAYLTPEIYLDKIGRQALYDATKKQTGKEVGFVHNNKLIVAPKVTAAINSGMISVASFNLSVDDITMLKRDLSKQ